MKAKRRFKFVGTLKNAIDYDCGDGNRPEVGRIYDEDVIFSEESVGVWATNDYIKHEWEEVDDNFKSPDDYYAGQKDVLSISGICAGVTFSISGDFVKCSQVLNYIFNLETK